MIVSCPLNMNEILIAVPTNLLRRKKSRWSSCDVVFIEDSSKTPGSGVLK